MTRFNSILWLTGISAILLPVALAMTVCGCTIPFTTSASAACVGSRPIARSEKLHVDGADLYLLTRGKHCDAPALLWLHGGPRGVERPLNRLYNRTLEQDFVVTYWDQRGAGRSFDPDADPTRLTVARHLEDLNHVVDHLRRLLRQDKLFLVGHSWGSALGLLYARDHADKVAGFAAVAPFVSGLESEGRQRAFVEAEARRQGDHEAFKELQALGAPPYTGAQKLRMQRLVDKFGGVFHTRPSFAWALLCGLVRGYATPWEVAKIIRANNASLEAMSAELAKLDLRRRVPAVDVPVVFMLGRYDRQLELRLAAAYYDKLQAPQKSLVWFENSAHNIPFEQPETFNETLRKEFRCLVKPDRSLPGGRTEGLVRPVACFPFG